MSDTSLLYISGRLGGGVQLYCWASVSQIWFPGSVYKFQYLQKYFLTSEMQTNTFLPLIWNVAIMFRWRSHLFPHHIRHSQPCLFLDLRSSFPVHQNSCIESTSKATATLEPETTQHNSLDRLQIGKQESKTLLFMLAATLKPIRLEWYLPRLPGAKWVCFEPTVWPDTCCRAHRIRVSLQWTKRLSV